MNPPSVNEVSGYLSGVFKMVQGDDAGLQELDLSTRGFWRSFWVLVYGIPAFCVIWAVQRKMRMAADPALELGASAFFRSVASELLGVAAVLLVVGLLARPMGIADRFAQWVISANWLTLPLWYFVASVYLAASSLTGGELFVFVAQLLTLIVYWRVYRVAFAGDGLLAFAVILISLFIGFTITFTVSA